MTNEVSVADLSDQHGDALAILDPMFRDFGAWRRFAGVVETLMVFEDNSLVRSTLDQPGNGRVLVVDGGGSLRCALLGDQLGELAVRNDWVGIVVYGCVRDTRRLAELPLGIKALHSHPRKSVKRGAGELGIDVRFAGVTIRAGDWLCADEDGIGVAAAKLA